MFLYMGNVYEVFGNGVMLLDILFKILFYTFSFSAFRFIIYEMLYHHNVQLLKYGWVPLKVIRMLSEKC